jgi:hypothetical protein
MIELPVGTFFSSGQVNWARTMLTAHRDGLEAFKQTLCSRLAELFPHLNELDCEQDTPLGEDQTIKAIIAGGLTWENGSEGHASRSFWEDADHADEASVSTISGLLVEIKDLRTMIRAGRRAIWQEEKRPSVRGKGDKVQEK